MPFPYRLAACIWQEEASTISGVRSATLVSLLTKTALQPPGLDFLSLSRAHTCHSSASDLTGCRSPYDMIAHVPGPEWPGDGFRCLAKKYIIPSTTRTRFNTNCQHFFPTLNMEGVLDTEEKRDFTTTTTTNRKVPETESQVHIHNPYIPPATDAYATKYRLRPSGFNCTSSRNPGVSFESITPMYMSHTQIRIEAPLSIKMGSGNSSSCGIVLNDPVLQELWDGMYILIPGNLVEGPRLVSSCVNVLKISITCHLSMSWAMARTTVCRNIQFRNRESE